ncbi:DUF2953 domain-containing protein [Anaerosalibacter massiliensis]|uniref:DUF2953 domain-containing protein n=1 Tax=Anaerosalibacter massiliensis TaxID=1347392 RepID=A0A9X2S3F0_9FIRM|nr:DUF2953 domain-containing protein [Anaerosalibacter massiliensis]MCR2042645.1 DUF2953 domain-containing protein [Anaerosalibacter massiliensis]
MKWFLIILVVFLVILLWPLYIVIDFRRKESNEINIQLIALKGLIKYKIDNEKIIQRYKRRKKNDGEKEFKIKRYLKYYNQYKKVISFFWKRGEIKKIHWITDIGSKDAALTGIYTGLFWAIKNSVLSILINKREIDDIYINIYPYFNKSKFETRFNCIIKSNLVYIIIISLYGLSIKKVVNKNGRTSYRRANENYNE